MNLRVITAPVGTLIKYIADRKGNTIIIARIIIDRIIIIIAINRAVTADLIIIITDRAAETTTDRKDLITIKAVSKTDVRKITEIISIEEDRKSVV